MEKCKNCAKFLTCTKCTGQVKWIDTKNYGVLERRELNENNK